MAQPDKLLPKRDTYELVESEGKIYNASLQQTDFKKNENKFYIIQLLQNKKGKKKNYTLFTRWGRMGHDGQQAVSPSVDTLQKGINLYNKKYDEKIKKYCEIFDDDDEEEDEQLEEEDEDEELEQIEIPKAKPVKKAKQAPKRTPAVNNKKMALEKDENSDQESDQDQDNQEKEAQVDEYCPNKNKYEVIKDRNKTYSVYLEEQNKFYYLQALRSKTVKGRQFFLYTRYGKKNAKGSVNLSAGFKTQQVALDLYSEKYSDKTMKGNYIVVAETIEEALEEEMDNLQLKKNDKNKNKKQKKQKDEDEEEEEEEIQQIQPKKQKKAPKLEKKFPKNKKVVEEIEESDEDEQQNDDNEGFVVVVDEYVDDRDEYSVYIDGSKMYHAYMEQDTKFYLIQILQKNNDYFFYNRYGKIDQEGRKTMSKKLTKVQAIKEYEKKHNDKSKKGGYSVINRKDSYLGYKQLQKDNYITFSSMMNILQNKIIRQQVFNNFLPKEISMKNVKYGDNSLFEQIIKTPDPLQYMGVTKLQFSPYNLEIYSKFIKQVPKLMPNIEELTIDYTCLNDDEGVEEEKDLLLTFLSRNLQLKKLDLLFTQVVFSSQAVRRFANIVSKMTDLNYLSFEIYEHGADRESLKFLFKKLLLLRKLEYLHLEFWDEDPMPYRTAKKLFSHIKTFKMEYEDDDDYTEDEEESEQEDNEE